MIAERDVVAGYHREGLRKDARLAHVAHTEEDVERIDVLQANGRVSPA